MRQNQQSRSTFTHFQKNPKVKDRKAKQFRVQGLTERLNVFEERLKELQTQDKQRISSVNVSINKVHEAFEKLDMTGEGIDKVSFTNLNESMGILNVEMKKETEVIFSIKPIAQKRSRKQIIEIDR